MNLYNIQDLRDKVADIKYDTQQVLDRIDSMDSAYQEQTGREQALQNQVDKLKSEGALLTERIDEMKDSAFASRKTIEHLKAKLSESTPTMPVIPKAVAIAIFREGMAYGASNVCDELDNADSIMVEDSDHVGNFEVSFSMYVDLTDHLDLDFLRSAAVDNADEEWVVDCLNNLCATEKFECRIHGIDDQQTKDND